MEKINLTTLSSLPEQVWGIGTVLAAVGVGTLIAFLIIWTLTWKGLALWRAAKQGARVWFVILLVVNTIGILDLIYYFYGSHRSWGKK